MIHVWVAAAVIRNMNRSPSPQPAFVTVLEILQAMQIVQVPFQRRLLAIDFKGVEGFVAAGVTRRFKRRQRPVVEPRQESTGIVNSDLLHLPRQSVLALLDE